ncbi:hypothetical protein EUGRSUZ_B03323 [Eucalyptus grandis]|uniref:Uncharacterized protein n=2 Tax=Eucalyptus grandis TaxID=71139 RepID=A0ACC3LW96_EUCGR|nr:hypothetical protein EUGRSUZ_B03323 [Eucalyptus grandis]
MDLGESMESGGLGRPGLGELTSVGSPGPDLSMMNSSKLPNVFLHIFQPASHCPIVELVMLLGFKLLAKVSNCLTNSPSHPLAFYAVWSPSLYNML